MSNYLERLVERTLGTGTMVQPLIAPFYSSDPPLIDSFGEAWEQTETTFPDPPAVVERIVLDEGDRSRQPSTSAEAVDSAQRIEDISPPQSTLPPPGQESYSPVQPAARPDPQPSEFTAHETLPTPAILDSSPENPTELEDTSIDEPGVERSETGESEYRGQVHFAAPPRQMGNDEERPVREEGGIVNSRGVRIKVPSEPSGEIPSGIESVEPGATNVPSEPERPPRPVDITNPELNNLVEPLPNVGSPTLPSRTEISTQPEPQPQPVIRVSIGRIEVRAVQQQATPPRPSPPRPKPVLSLDEYLKQRNGGE